MKQEIFIRSELTTISSIRNQYIPPSVDALEAFPPLFFPLLFHLFLPQSCASLTDAKNFADKSDPSDTRCRLTIRYSSMIDFNNR